MSEIKPFTGIDDRKPLCEFIPLNTPFTLNIFPSNVCNFRCNYCAQNLGVKRLEQEYGFGQEIMTLDILEQIISQVKKFPEKLRLVSMMGHGEPLCNKNLPEMISKVKLTGITRRIDVITNASLLNPEYSERLIDSGLDVLRVSLQGITSEAYAKTCNVKLDFDKFYNNISYFYKHKKNCKVFVKVVDSALKEGEEKLFYEMFSSISDRMYIDKIKPVYDKVFYSEEERDLSVDRYGNKHLDRIVCPQPFYMLSVWANGDVTPCCALYKASFLGNVQSSELKQMWDSNKRNEFCIKQLMGKRKEIAQCSKCCAPDDVQHEQDVLDWKREELLSKLTRF